MSSHVLMIARVAQPFGGIIHYVCEVAEAMLAAGFRVTLVANEPVTRAESFRRVSRAGGEFREIQIPDTPKAFAHELDRVVGTIQPDVIHLNDSSRLTRAAIPRMSTLQRFVGRRVVTLHADILLLGRPGAARAASYLPWTKVACRKREVAKFLEQFDVSISVSEAFARLIPRMTGISSTRIVPIPNGVDLDKFRPSALFRDDGPMTVAASGGFFRYKRFDVLISAAALLKDRIPIRIKIAGAGREAKNLKSQAAELGVAEFVDFTGPVSDMPEFLRAADAFVFCSDSTETSSYSQLEAMATGLPSVCSRYGDLPLRVRDGVDGFLVPPGDPKTLAEKLELLARQPELRRQMGSNARHRVRGSYSKQVYLNRTLKVFQALKSSSCAGTKTCTL